MLAWWYPGGKLHTTAKTCTPFGVGSGAIGTGVSSQFVKEPHRWTWGRGSAGRMVSSEVVPEISARERPDGQASR